MPTRRQFIKVGVAGAALLAAVRLLDRPLAAPPAAKYRVLADRDAAIVAALTPIVLEGALPEEPGARAGAVTEVVEAFDRAVSGLAPAVQEEIGQLFSLLDFAPSRIALAGLWSPIDQSAPGELREFLRRWRTGRFDLQRSGYSALTQLMQASWYGNSASWAAIGYPGPPVLA